MENQFSTRLAARSFAMLAKSGNIAMLERHEALGRPVFDRYGRNFGVHFAAIGGRLNAVVWFLDRGMDVNIAGYDEAPFGLFAAERGFFDILRLFLDRGGDPVLLEEIGLTPFQRSILFGASDADIFAIIDDCSGQVLEHHCNSVIGDSMITEKSRVFEFQAIHLAAHFGRLDVVRSLIDAGADPNATSYRGWTPFLSAAQRGHLDVMQFLHTFEIDINTVSFFGDTAANLAAMIGNVEILIWLESLGADMESFVEDKGTILSCAIRWNQYECCRWLIEESGLQGLLDTKRAYNLRIALRNQSLPIVRLLLFHGFRFRAAPLFACHCFHTGLLDICLAEGFSFENEHEMVLRTIEAEDWDAFDWLVAHDHFSWARTVFNLIDLDLGTHALQELKRRGFDFHILNNHGQNLFFHPMMYVTREFLIEEGLDPNIVDFEGNSASCSDSLAWEYCFLVVIGFYPRSIPFELFPCFSDFLGMDCLPTDVDVFEYFVFYNASASLRVLAMHGILERDVSLMKRIDQQYPLALRLAALVTPQGVETLRAFEFGIDFEELLRVLEEKRFTYLANRCREESARPDFSIDHFEIL